MGCYCLSRRNWIVGGQRCEWMQVEGTTKDDRVSLVISFVLKSKGAERIDGDGLWPCLSLIVVMEV